jgi:hypothetical protein
MFHFTRCLPIQLSLGGNMTSSCWVPPFGDSRVKGCLPPHRDFSQVATSFISSQRQGIHHTPFFLQLLKQDLLQQVCNVLSYTVPLYLLILSTLILVFSCQGYSQTSWPERRAFAPQGLRPGVCLAFDLCAGMGTGPRGVCSIGAVP